MGPAAKTTQKTDGIIKSWEFVAPLQKPGTKPQMLEISTINQTFIYKMGELRRGYCGSHPIWVTLLPRLSKRIKLKQTNELLLLNEIHSSRVRLKKVQRFIPKEIK